MFLVIFEASRELPPALSLPKGQSRAVGRDARPYLMTDSPTPSPTLPRLPIFQFYPFLHFPPAPSRTVSAASFSTSQARTRPFGPTAVPGGPRHSEQISDRRHPVGRDARPGRPTLPDRFTNPVSRFSNFTRFSIFRLPPRARFSRPLFSPLHVVARPLRDRPAHRPPTHRPPSHRPPRHLRCTFQPGDHLGSTHPRIDPPTLNAARHRLAFLGDFVPLPRS